jgi:hypothetical protein
MQRTDCYGLPVIYLRFRVEDKEVNTKRKRVLLTAAARALKEKSGKLREAAALIRKTNQLT